jgi:hypothetical protein
MVAFIAEATLKTLLSIFRVHFILSHFKGQQYSSMLWGVTGPELRSSGALLNGQYYNRRQGYALASDKLKYTQSFVRKSPNVIRKRI